MPEDKGLTRSQREEKVLQFWKENKIFEKSLDKAAPKGNFIFYEGPPTANGKPGIHHLAARAFKDAIPRYKTMRGYHVPRKAGWDTHGLPVELEVEKKLGIKNKKEIEEFGVERFNAECRKNALSYISDWSRFTERIGYWADLEHAYFTFDNSYIEAVWGAIAHVDERGLLYKDYKVVPWCPRDGTALSSHELAQGYEEVKDISLYVKFKLVDFPDAYFLAWTTTPWTLPGNLALAVGPDITYVEARVGKDIYVLAKDRLSILAEPYEVIAEHKGSEMAGMAYEPLYPFLKDKSDKSFKVYTADFVTTADGTGIVHTAVMYGQEDFELGKKIGLPMIHLVNPDGTFTKDTDWLEDRSVVEEQTAVEILKDLQSRGLLYKKESYQHSYPFCWRCHTRLIYYARDSWYIRMSSLRDELVKENEKIHWEPEHIKEGRFGEWLREVKDWALSRERYWGTPLPVWVAKDGERMVVDSIETLKKHAKKSGNKYFVMRHGEAVYNAKHMLDPKGDPSNHLTEAGKKEIKASATDLKQKRIDLIFTSPFIRTRETAEVMKAELDLSDDKVIIDERLHEFNEGDEMVVRRRVGEFLFEIERLHSEKNILIISHGNPLWTLMRVAANLPTSDFADRVMLLTGEVREVPFSPFPHNDDFELDLHKPYIDEVVLEKEGKEYKRAKEVMDVWLDSGSMPFAQDPKNILYPADFISEAIDQTRGWFYTLHAIGILMGRGRAFKNVISLGHILDKEGKKMSKSVGNVIEPFQAIEKYGADTLRLWMYSVNQPGEPKNFDERTVEEVQKRIFNLLDNVYAFYELYRDKTLESDKYPDSKHVLDKWILTKLSILVSQMTENIDDYKLLEPVRDLRDFISDLSTWYLRRSRDRLKDGDRDAKKTLYYVLKTVSKLLGPFAPFAAEELYQKLKLKDDSESVHLEEWPAVKKSLFGLFDSGNQDLLKNMEDTRRIVSLALEARSKANIKIRQPLQSISAKLDGAYADLIKDEVNVKDVKDTSVEGVMLDTLLTPELIEEGRVRETLRSIQDMRKEKGLRPSEKMELAVPEGEREFYEKHRETIESATNTALVNK